MKKLITIFILSMFIISCGNNGNTNDDSKYNVNGVSLSKRNKQITPKGAIVYSQDGADFNFLSNVDLGLTEAFNNARLSGWTKNMEYPSYIIYIPVKPCTPSPEQRVDSFQVESGNSSAYNGSIYDQYNTKGLETDPVRLEQGYKWRADEKTIILASEMVITQNENQMEMIVCNGAVTMNGAQYGAEHYLAGSNDYEYYELTKEHLIRTHPILPKSTNKLSSQQTLISKSNVNESIINKVK